MPEPARENLTKESRRKLRAPCKQPQRVKSVFTKRPVHKAPPSAITRADAATPKVIVGAAKLRRESKYHNRYDREKAAVIYSFASDPVTWSHH
jgi:hypothetical protein